MVEYTALLTMYGEKSEETEELRMDLQDLKEMYKLQVRKTLILSSLSEMSVFNLSLNSNLD
jgi:hypothetical protein